MSPPDKFISLKGLLIESREYKTEQKAWLICNPCK